jgi:hypothetical protein
VWASGPQQNETGHSVVREEAGQRLFDNLAGGTSRVPEQNLPSAIYQKPRMKDIKPRPGRDKQYHITGSDEAPDFGEASFWKTSKAGDPRAQTRYNIEPSNLLYCVRPSREVDDRPPAFVVSRPVDHVVIAMKPIDRTAPVSNQPELVAEMSRGVRCRERKDRLDIRHAVKALERASESLFRCRTPAKRIGEIRQAKKK